jgi:hypothetical protein
VSAAVLDTAPEPQAAPEPAAAPAGPSRLARRICWGLIGLTLILWLASLPSLGHAAVSQYGLLATASPLFGISLLLNGIAFAACVRARLFHAAAVAVVLMTITQRLPDTIATQVPLYSWTYKHIGVVNYIQVHGQLAHGVDVYQGWPGLFALTAWFSDITGVDPITLAHWFTPAFHLAMVALVYVVARVWRLGPFPALVASFLVETMNWVAQDYYSPQATAFVLAMGFLILLGLSQQRPACTPLALLLFAAITITHQLTPYWLILVVLLLTITRRLQPRWLIWALIAIAGAYLAFNYDSVSQFTLFSPDPVSNAQSNVPTVGVLGQRLTSKLIRGLSVVLWVSAALCAVASRRRRIPVLDQAVLAFSAFLLLGGQGYGGEAIFRVFLYSLPGCGLIIAPYLVAALSRSYRLAVATCILLVGCIAASAQGFYASWFANKISREQVTAAQNLMNTADYPSYLTVAAPTWPGAITARYVDFVGISPDGGDRYDDPMIYAADLVHSDFSTDDEYNKFISTIAARRNGPTYLIITRQMSIYDWYFGILPIDALDNLQVRMRADPRWSIYEDNSQLVIFKTNSTLTGTN